MVGTENGDNHESLFDFLVSHDQIHGENVGVFFMVVELLLLLLLLDRLIRDGDGIIVGNSMLYC